MLKNTKSKSRLLKGRRATPRLAKTYSSRCSWPRRGSKSPPWRTYAVFLRSCQQSTHTHTHTRIHKHGTKNQKNTCLAPLPQCYAEAAARDLGSKVLPAKRERYQRGQKKKTQRRASTCCSVVSSPGWPRVRWYGIASRFVPLSQSWGVTSGTYLTEKK